MKRFPRGVSDLILALMKLFMLKPEQGTRSSLTAAFSPFVRKGPNAKEYRGAYLLAQGQLAKPSDAALNDSLAVELWNTTIDILKEINVEFPEI